MARIPADQLERIKRDVSLVDWVERDGHTVRCQGKDYAMACPFHEDDTPSLIITPGKNLFNCFGCGASGSVIDWVMKTRGASFRHAVAVLNDALPSLAADNSIPLAAPSPRLDPLPLNDNDQSLLNDVIEYYHETLLASPEALAYLEKRGLANSELVSRFKLGYANRTLGYRLPPKQLKAGKQLRGQLQGVGLLRSSGHEHFNGSLVVPVLDGSGNVVEVYGRKLLDNLRKGTPKHLYLPGPHSGVWNADGLVGYEEVILCEALIDAMTFWVHGFTNVTASYGTGGFTEEHLALFTAGQVQRVLIAYDRDEAGNTAAEHVAAQLGAQGIGCYRLHFPKGMDVNQYALEVQPAKKSLGVVIRTAEWMGPGEAPMPSVPTSSLPLTQGTRVARGADSAAEPSIDDIPVSAVPPVPVDEVEPIISAHEVTVAYGDRHYRVRGLDKNTSYDVLKVNVLVRIGDWVHVDTFDLYSAKHRQGFARMVAAECELKESIIQRDLGQLLMHLEGLQDQAIQSALAPKEPVAYALSESERTEALTLLTDPDLVGRIVTDFERIGLVGEPTNALMGYLATVSRKLANPLAIIVQSTSAAGKSALMDAVLTWVPEEDRVQYSAMTGQSLFYLGDTELKHTVLAISEEEGVRQAAYALKLLQSQGELTMASTGKDPQTGKLVTEEYRVEGPVMLFLTTTAIDIDEELLNRCVVLTINESREQTAAIQQRQRAARTLSGLLASTEANQCIAQHQNAQRLLRPLAVVNPFAEYLQFADSRTRTRRDHAKYLTLIDSIALLHQYQRDTHTVRQGDQVIEYVEVTLGDIALANRLAHAVLGRSLDELPPPTRQLLNRLHTLVADKVASDSVRAQDVRFTRREVRDAAGLSDTQVRVHLERLVSLEYVLAHHGRNGQRYVYELVFDGEVGSDQPQLMGLIDVEQLRNIPQPIGMTTNLADESMHLAARLRSANGHLAVGLHTPEKDSEPRDHGALHPVDTQPSEISAPMHITPQNNGASYRTASLAAEG